MQAIIDENNKIKSLFISHGNLISIPDTEKIIDVPDDFKGKYLDDIRMWDKDYKLRDAEDNIKDGYVVLQEDEKIVEHKIVKLSEEEKALAGIITLDEYIIRLKAKKTEEILGKFDINLLSGSFKSTAIGIDIDCRRSGSKNDLQNIQGLISNMTRNSITTIDYVGVSEIKSKVTIANLNKIILEMEDYTLGLYQKKWDLLSKITTSTTITQLNSITW